MKFSEPSNPGMRTNDEQLVLSGAKERTTNVRARAASSSVLRPWPAEASGDLLAKGTLRIAHVSATFPPYPGGTGNVCFHNARELARRGHDAWVFTAAAAGAAPREQVDGVTVMRLRPPLRIGNAPVLPGLPRALRGFDIIHLHAPFILGAELTALAAMLGRTPFVVTYHNDLIRSGTWRDPIFSLATRSLRHAALYRAARVLFVSRGHAETSEQSVVYRRRGRHSQVLLNAVDTQIFRPGDDRTAVRAEMGLPADAPLVGFVGGLDGAHHYKGLNVLLEALASPALADAYVLVIGDGELRAGYQEQARRLGLGDRALFRGAVAQGLLPPLYRACDVVAIPSLVPEALPLTLVESLGCGVPVVASDGPGVRSVLDDGVDGLLTQPRDAAGLARALDSIVRDPERRRQMGRRGHAKVAAQYSWSERGARLEAIYREVLDERRRACSERLSEKGECEGRSPSRHPFRDSSDGEAVAGVTGKRDLEVCDPLAPASDGFSDSL